MMCSLPTPSDAEGEEFTATKNPTPFSATRNQPLTVKPPQDLMANLKQRLNATVPYHPPCSLSTQSIVDIFTEDVISRILRLVLDPDLHLNAFHTALHWSTDKRDAPPDSARHLAAATAACRTFHRLGVPHLYRNLFFYMPRHVNRPRLLYRTLLARPDYLEHCETAFIVRQPDPSDEWIALGAGPGHTTWAEEVVPMKVKQETQRLLTMLAAEGVEVRTRHGMFDDGTFPYPEIGLDGLEV
ncbi:hypothetical protein VTI74DRAFT_7334 [Chaetomium olivicolor]